MTYEFTFTLRCLSFILTCNHPEDYIDYYTNKWEQRNPGIVTPMEFYKKKLLEAAQKIPGKIPGRKIYF